MQLTVKSRNFQRFHPYRGPRSGFVRHFATLGHRWAPVRPPRHPRHESLGLVLARREQRSRALARRGRSSLSRRATTPALSGQSPSPWRRAPWRPWYPAKSRGEARPPRGPVAQSPRQLNARENGGRPHRRRGPSRRCESRTHRSSAWARLLPTRGTSCQNTKRGAPLCRVTTSSGFGMKSVGDWHPTVATECLLRDPNSRWHLASFVLAAIDETRDVGHQRSVVTQSDDLFGGGVLFDVE